MEYTVTITAQTDPPISDLEAVADMLPESGVSAIDNEISITTTVEADDVLVAGSLARHTLVSILNDVDLVAVVELDVVEADRMDARLAESNFPDLVSAPEVGEILGVSRQRVHQLINENASFPPPIVRLGAGPLWLRATIVAWNETWTRKPGRPRLTGADAIAQREKIRQDVDAASGGHLSEIQRRKDASVAEVTRGLSRGKR